MITMKSILTLNVSNFQFYPDNVILYGYVTTLSYYFLTSSTYYKLKNTPLTNENSVHTINPDIHMMYEAHATVNIYRAECSYYYQFDSQISFSLTQVNIN
jgi:hypothetical protein